MRTPAALLAALTACNEFDIAGREPEPGVPAPTVPDPPVYTGDCSLDPQPAESTDLDDACGTTEPFSGFEPVVDWEAGPGENCRATVAVGDLDQDGMPEIVASFSGLLPGSPTDLVVLDGDTGAIKARIPASLGYGSSPALGDLDGDGTAEIVVVASFGSDLPFGDGDYRVAAFSASGEFLWQSISFTRDDFDYATAPVLSDMDHDGLVEIVAGRVILNWDGSVRGVGTHGRGSWGIALGVSEAAVSAVADIDLDGEEEVIVGDAVYAIDGTDKFFNPAAWDGMVGVANLDDDAEGEIVVSSFNTVRAVDTNGTVLWGPFDLPDANITSPPAIGDIDGDGMAEIIVAGGDRVWALNHDGSVLWDRPATDMSGASGASIFDFEGDGSPEIAYIDEIQMQVFDGPTGATKFKTSEHASDTMMDYPVIADVDADGHADIVFGHANYGVALTVYRDVYERWVPTRSVWNQHAYSITNVESDLSIPLEAVPNFLDSNLWHGAKALGVFHIPEALGVDLAGEILDVCDDACEFGVVAVLVRVRNIGPGEVEGPINVALYGVEDGVQTLLGTAVVMETIPSGMTSASLAMEVDAALVDDMDELVLVADEDATGSGHVDECDEENNSWVAHDPFCN